MEVLRRTEAGHSRQEGKDSTPAIQVLYVVLNTEYQGPEGSIC